MEVKKDPQSVRTVDSVKQKQLQRALTGTSLKAMMFAVTLALIQMFKTRTNSYWRSVCLCGFFSFQNSELLKLNKSTA